MKKHKIGLHLKKIKYNMPTFTQYIDVDVEIEEFIDQLSSWEIEELINYLKSEGHLNDVSSPKMNIQDIEWSF